MTNSPIDPRCYFIASYIDGSQTKRYTRLTRIARDELDAERFGTAGEAFTALYACLDKTYQLRKTHDEQQMVVWFNKCVDSILVEKRFEQTLNMWTAKDFQHD